jgi:hypothetical protein
MKLTLRTLVTCAATAFALASASAQELFIYDNTTANTGSYFPNGGAALVGANTITTLVADDLTPISGYSGMAVSNIYFSVVNANAAAVSARPRLRIWDATGAGGGPGNFLTGFTFNAISFTANSESSFFFHPTGFNVPSGTFWMGLTFDNNSGATGATAAQLNNLGMALFSPPNIGTSADSMFQTSAAGDFLVNNPAGSIFNFGGNPPADVFFGISVALVPEPASMTLVGLGLAGLIFFRRRK